LLNNNIKKQIKINIINKVKYVFGPLRFQ